MGGGGHNVIFYLQNPQTPKSYHKVILDSLKSYPITPIKSLSKAKDCDCLITDTSALALLFNLQFQTINFKTHKEFWQNLREKNIYNIGSSSEAIKEEIDKILKGKQ